MRRSIQLLLCNLVFFLSLFCACFSYSSSLEQSCLHEQMSALLQLKNEQSCSYNYDTLKSWKFNTNCCSWTGVTCDGHTGHVIGLDLSSSGLCGSIHPFSGLFHLHHLQSLTLFNNSFNGSISFGFDQLSELTHLDLSWNYFGGQLCGNSSLFLLPNLQTLDLSSNIFEGSILYGFDQLSKLVHLDLSWNFFHDQIHANSSLFHLLNLQTLDLSSNNFEGSILYMLDPLPKLTHLDLSRNSFHGQIHANSSVFHLLNLQTLDLSNNYFEGSIPYGFHRLYKLTHLALGENYFVGQIPLEISRLTNLVSLDLSFNTGLKLEKPNLGTLIHNLSSLTELHLDSVNTLDYGKNYWYRSLSSMLPNLQRLLLSNCSLSGPMDASLSNLHFLSELDLSLNNLSFMSIQDLLGRLPSLTILRLSSTGLCGELLSNFFSLQPNLQDLDLSYNNLLSGNLPEFPHVNSLRYLYVISTPLCKYLPKSISNLKLLERLYLSNCSLFGSIPSILSSFANLSNLYQLDLSYNSLTGQIPSFMRDKFPNLLALRLSNNLLEGPIPPSFANLTQLETLNLSNNSLTGQISSVFKDGFPNLSNLRLRNNFLQGPIPSSLANLTNLYLLDLSYNNFTGQIHSFFKNGFSNILYIILRNNLFKGPVPSSLLSIPTLKYIDLSHNQFNDILNDFSNNTKLVGKFPTSAYLETNVEVLDLSYNKLSCVIPRCFGYLFGNLSVLNLEQNNLYGPIPDAYTKGCKLQIVKVNGNRLQGKLPTSMENCNDMEVLDVGNNHLSGTFPFWLQSLPQLRVLILQSNKFNGPIAQKSTVANSHSPFPMLHVFDIALNSFTGELPLEYICQWKSMLISDVPQLSNYISSQNTSVFYQVSLQIVIKGIFLEMEKIIETFTTINLSGNKFQGNISVAIGELKALMGLNLSANDLIGRIPSSFSQLIKLESLDLSRNSLSGEIPQQLAALTFLSVLNLSQNHLTGRIPQGNQFGTFSEASYEGNAGLCGSPLPKRCGVIGSALPPASALEKEEDSTSLLDWRFLVAGCCSGAIIGVVIGHTMFWRIIGCIGLMSRMRRLKGRQVSRKSKRHGRVK